MPQANGKLLIALDYDGTYTADPEFWLDFIKMSEARGHEIVVATMRTPEEKETMDDKLLDAIPWVVTTSRKAKKQFLLDYGIAPDIWIDDHPLFLLQDATPIKE